MRAKNFTDVAPGTLVVKHWGLLTPMPEGERSDRAWPLIFEVRQLKTHGPCKSLGAPFKATGWLVAGRVDILGTVSTAGQCSGIANFLQRYRCRRDSFAQEGPLDPNDFETQTPVSKLRHMHQIFVFDVGLPK